MDLGAPWETVPGRSRGSLDSKFDRFGQNPNLKVFWSPRAEITFCLGSFPGLAVAQLFGSKSGCPGFLQQGIRMESCAKKNVPPDLIFGDIRFHSSFFIASLETRFMILAATGEGLKFYGFFQVARRDP